jgi:hypothetical protein
MAKVQMLHLMAASSPINVSKSDPHEAQERIHLVLNNLQEIGDDFASTTGKSVPTTAHSIIQLQQSANESSLRDHIEIGSERGRQRSTNASTVTPTVARSACCRDPQVRRFEIEIFSPIA